MTSQPLSPLQKVFTAQGLPISALGQSWVNQPKAQDLLGIAGRDFKDIANSELLPRQGYCYPESYLKSLREFAGKHQVDRSLAWLYLLHNCYKYAQDEAARNKFQQLCRELVDADALMTGTQVSAVTKKGRPTIWRWSAQGYLPAAMVDGYRFYLPWTVHRLSPPANTLDSEQAAIFLDISRDELRAHNKHGLIDYTGGSNLPESLQRRYHIQDLEALGRQIILKDSPGVEEAAEWLNLDGSDSIRRWWRKGLIAGVKFRGKLRFEWTELARVRNLLQTRTINTEFDWLHSYLLQSRRKVTYHTNRGTLAKLGRDDTGFTWLKNQGDKGFLPYYICEFDKGLSFQARLYPGPYIEGLVRYLDGRKSSRSLLGSYRDLCCASRPQRVV